MKKAPTTSAAKTSTTQNVSGMGITGAKAATTTVRTGSASRTGSATEKSRGIKPAPSKSK